MVSYGGHESSSQGVAFSPRGARLVSTGYAGLVIVWDIETGEAALRLGGRSHGLPSIDFAPDGSWFATAGSDGSVNIWETRVHDAGAP